MVWGKQKNRGSTFHQKQQSLTVLPVLFNNIPPSGKQRGEGAHPAGARKPLPRVIPDGAGHTAKGPSRKGEPPRRSDQAEDSRDGGIEACRALYKDRIGTQSYRKLPVICPKNGTKQTVYQNRITVGAETYWGVSGGCENATECPECRQCRLNATLRAIEE